MLVVVSELNSEDTGIKILVSEVKGDFYIKVIDKRTVLLDYVIYPKKKLKVFCEEVLEVLK